MKSTITPSCLYWHARRFWVQDLNCLVCVICIFIKATATAWFVSLLWASRPQCLKFSWTQDAGRHKPLTLLLSTSQRPKCTDIACRKEPCKWQRSLAGYVVQSHRICYRQNVSNCSLWWKDLCTERRNVALPWNVKNKHPSFSSRRSHTHGSNFQWNFIIIFLKGYKIHELIDWKFICGNNS